MAISPVIRTSRLRSGEMAPLAMCLLCRLLIRSELSTISKPLERHRIIATEIYPRDGLVPGNPGTRVVGVLGCGSSLLAHCSG